MAKLEYDETGRLLFTEEMKEEYTILIPSMAPYHFGYFVPMLESEGYKAEVLTNVSFEVIHEGMKYSHNDICVPAMLVIGQFIDAMKNSGYDINKVALMITQTGGGCRASNYVSLIRKAFIQAGYEFIPIVSVNAVGLEKNPGFKITANILLKLITGLVMGDMIMSAYNEVAPYELNKGDTEKAYQEVNKSLHEYFHYPSRKVFYHPTKLFDKVLKRFSEVEVDRSIKKPKVGIVGEIYVKYSPLGNNNLEQTLRNEGCEAITPSIMDFFLYTFDSSRHDIYKYGGRKIVALTYRFLIRFVEFRKGKVRKLQKKYGFRELANYYDLRSFAKGYIPHAMHVGEGWLLTAEMVELIHMGAPNIVCTQPFGCLPNHIAGKGMIKKLKKNFPESNIVAIDYDTSATEINQLNRIKLMISNAKNNL
ncbi:2-hydroxyglutaryl-CoA dehydratase, D-component [Candidatus Izimaplasma bacterium HR1]|jgi:predicted nucleotide-binding protein (sugar kinase/HSP70/actin superfamily)|uniref:2-hydroxyacyl-CoA dehydratase n=1 Tax=Candidatus Izimoplasma sp. HR1 TaxID=1541959 RepID=UPI0004F6B9EC|nr:2-hydroxyglutaryl-CoA dehydratase, D-component [Candidatus Izimaplasma bacterium HR1]